MIKLWRKNSFGLGTWRIWSDAATIYYAHTSSEGGAEIIHSETVTTNQSGRSLDQQIELEINSRVSRQLDKGYKPTRDEALKGSTNQLGLVNPMLALPLDRIRFGAHDKGYVQPKYDGHRCLITKQGNEVVAYTRKGKLIETIPHIIEDVDRWLPEGVTLDGELYVHGAALQSISSLIKRDQPGSGKLRFHWYDLVDRFESFDTRFKTMLDLAKHVKEPRIELVPTEAVEGIEQVYEYFKRFRAEGFEGAMLRRNTRGYEDAKRSDSLIKVKERIDGEVTVVSIRPSKDGWAICHVRTDWGVEFDISAPGDLAQKTRTLNHSDQFIGKRLTIEFAGLTADQVPFHAVATRWREDL